MRIKKGDMVIVRSGKFKGRTAKVASTQPAAGTVTLEGINVVTRHQKPTSTNPQAGSREITRPLSLSKVAFYDASAKKASRIGFSLDKAGEKKRLMKTSGKEIK